jgi:hypothetical protein
VIVVGKETVKVWWKEQKCCTFRSDDYPSIILDAVNIYVNVVTEGPPQSFFDQSAGNDATIAKAAAEEAPNMPPRMNDHNEVTQAVTAIWNQFYMQVDGFTRKTVRNSYA